MALSNPSVADARIGRKDPMTAARRKVKAKKIFFMPDLRLEAENNNMILP